MLSRIKSSLSVLSPDAARLNVSTALASFPIGFLSIVLPIYLNKIGLDSAVIGQLYTVSAVTSAVLLIAFGLLADRYGRKPFVIAGTLLPLVSYVVFLTSTDTWLLMLAAGVGGVGLANGLSGALAGSSFNALLAEKTSDANRTTVFSIASAAWTLALMAGSLIGGMPEWLQQSFGLGVIESYRPLFWIAIIVTVLGGVVLFPIQEQHARSADHQRLADLIPRRSALTITKLSVVMGLIGLGLGFSVQLLPLWFYLKFGASGDVLGPWYAASEALSTLALYLVPRMARKFGTINTILVTQGTSALLLGAMVIAPSASIGAAFYLLRNILMNMAWPAQQSYIMGVVDRGERATANSITSAAWGLCNAVSPAISGLWLSQELLSLPLLAGAGSYLLSVVLFFGLFRRMRPPEEHLPEEHSPEGHPHAVLTPDADLFSKSA
ncbi:MAG: MFS transporter [Chloroflexi bacterium]|nr:MFS transporter [Chloroflexota bacterium]